MTVVDVHAHLISPDAVREIGSALPEHAPHFEERDAGRYLVYPSGRESGPLPVGMTDVDVRLRDMDEQGVDLQLLSPSPPMFAYRLPTDAAITHARIVNDSTLAAAQTDPLRLRVLATLPLPDVDAALRELDRIGSDPQVDGVEIGANIASGPLDDPALDPLWAELQDRRSIVLVHPAPAESPQYSRHFLRNLVGNPTDTTLALGQLIFGGVAERFPNLQWIFVHGGGFAPYQIGRWDHAWAIRDGLRGSIPRPPSEYLRQFHFDTLTHDDDSLSLLGQRVGWDHVVLGTDYCFDMCSDDPVGEVRRQRLDSETERAVLGRNALDLLDAVIRPAARHAR